MKRIIAILVIGIMVGILFYLNMNDWVINDAISYNNQNLLKAHHSNIVESNNWINEWIFHEQSPLKFRVLWKPFVWGTWQFFLLKYGEFGFYISFVLWSFIYLFAATYVLWEIGNIYFENNPKIPLFGCAFFLCSPAIFYNFKAPVWGTPNDYLALLLIGLGFLALLTNKSGIAIFISCIAVFCRETTLILPLCYLVGYRKDKLAKRLIFFLLPCALWAGFRLYLDKNVAIDNPFIVFQKNWEQPGETILFLFITFGALLFPALLGFQEKKGEIADKWKLLISTSWIVPLIYTIHFLFARAREIGFGSVIYIYIIIFALSWLISKNARIKSTIKNPIYWVLVFISTLFVYNFRYLIYHPNNILEFFAYRHIFERFYDGGLGPSLYPQGGWFGIFAVHVGILFCITPFLIKIPYVTKEI